MERRWPIHAKPALFLPGLVLLAVGLWFGLGWLYDSQRFLGTYILRFALAPRIAAGDVVWVLVATVGVVALLLSHGRAARAARGGFWSPTLRVYPMMLVLAVFLAGFGFFFLFDASYRGGVEGDEFAGYVTLDYAGALDRGAQSIFAVMTLLAAGLAALLAFGFGPSPAARRKQLATRRPDTPPPAPARPAARRTRATRAQTI